MIAQVLEGIMTPCSLVYGSINARKSRRMSGSFC